MASEFEIRRALESFDALLQLALIEPVTAFSLIEREANCEKAYTGTSAALFNLGVLYGFLYAGQMPGQAGLEALVNSMRQRCYGVKPRDVIGQSRSVFVQPI